MNLFVDCHSFDEGGQGVVTYINNIYSTTLFSYKNINIYLAAHNVDKLKNYFIGTSFYYLKYPSKNKYMRLLFYIPFFQIKHKINISHFQYITPLIKIGKWIVTIHDVLFLEFPNLFPKIYRYRNYWLFYRSLKYSDFILTVSDYSKKAIKKYYPSIKKELFITPNCIEYKNLEKMEKPIYFENSQKYILFVGRIEKRKNHIFLCNSYIKSKLYEKYDLIFVGRDDLFSGCFYTYLSHIDVQVRKHIFVYKDVSDFDLKWFYFNASLFVFPSICEGFGIPPLEAASFDCSLICSNVTAMSDYTFLGDRLFDPNNERDCIQKMIKYVNNKSDIKLINSIIKERYNKEKINVSFVNYLMENINNTIK
jgi:glycosyltransferase involved in cell wall biosynthesis